jgi:hypothetical protein
LDGLEEQCGQAEQVTRWLKYFGALAGSLVGISVLAPPVFAIPSFPGAEGWGAVTVGGRGGAVLRVTNLNDSGPGTFRAACEASGPRTVVFDVSGIIQLTNDIKITNSYITIAGHTAPGDGIIVAGDTVDLNGGVSDVIVRYLRFRRGYDKARWNAWAANPGGNPDPRGQCLVGLSTTRNIMVDHVSVSWGTDAGARKEHHDPMVYQLRGVEPDQPWFREHAGRAGRQPSSQSSGL